MVAFARQTIGGRGNWLLTGAVLVAGVLLAAYVLLPTGDTGAVSRDDPCGDGTTGPTALAVFLFDFRKPLGDAVSSMPGVILGEFALAAPGGTEFRVYTLSGQRTMPLAVMGRACKPKATRGRANVDCSVTQRNPRYRDREADAFCARLDTMQRGVDHLAGQVPELPVPDSLLIEAIEEARLAFAASPSAGPHSFHIFSDMIQHSPWYSHLAAGEADWNFTAFENSRRERAPVFATLPPLEPRVVTEIFYVPRRGITEQRALRDAHQRFWSRYFDSVGMAAVFRDQPAMPRFAAATLEGSTGLGRLVEERELLRREQAENAETLALVNTRRADLEQARQSAASSDRELEERERNLLAEQAREREEIEAERAEIARLEAELATLREDRDDAG